MTDDSQVGGGGTSVAPRPVLFAIGDIHGAYHAIEEILETLDQRYKIFTDENKCVLADHVTLVFTGDYVDRGEHAIQALNRLADIKQGSSDRLILLMGNHEAMALTALHAFLAGDRGDDSSQLHALIARYLDPRNGGDALFRNIAENAGVSDNDMQKVAAFFIEEIGRNGKTGSLLRKLELLRYHNINGRSFLFSHGDVPAQSRNKETLLQLAKEFANHVGEHTLYGYTSWWQKYNNALPGYEVLWGRDYTRIDFWGRTSEEEAATAEEICRACGVDYIVAGHTPTDGRIRVFGDRIVHIDVGMVFGRPPTAMMVSDAGIASVTKAGYELRVKF
jgi:Mor family transcriptional regulator